MKVLHTVISTVLLVTVAALPPCDDARRLDGSPCDPQIAVSTAPPTAPPTQPPTILVPVLSTTPPKPHLHVEPVCLQPSDPDFKQLPGAFKPWVAYKYLKANGPFVTTASKDLMGGQSLQVKNAGTPIPVKNFTCVKEDNEWKARIKNEALILDVLTIRLLDGWCDAWDVSELGPKPMHCLTPVEECLLQDISLYRSMDDMLGLRFDYGHCPISGAGTKMPGTKQATIMIGLKRVPDSGTDSTPNVRAFFEELCHTETPIGNPDATSLDLAMAKKPDAQQTCFAATADSEDVSALNQAQTMPCFNDFRVYTLLDVNNRYPVLPVMDSDYSWLLSKLPVGRNPQDSPCAKVNQAKAMYGRVELDRVCVHFEGLQEITCNNTCGKVCNSTNPNSGTTTPGPTIPPAICIDCELNELIYAILATLIVVPLAYYTYMSNSMSWVAVWFFVPLPKKPHEHFDSLSSQNFPNHVELNKQLHWPACLGLFFIAGTWSFIIYYVINLFDTLLCWLIGMEQCVRVWPWQYVFDEQNYMNVNGTFVDMQKTHLTTEEAGLLILPWTGPNRIINVDWCPGRLLGMIVATWFSTCLLMCLWRMEQKVAIMKTTIKQEIIFEETGMAMGGGMSAVGGGAAGAGGMLTKTLAFFGGRYVPP